MKSYFLTFAATILDLILCNSCTRTELKQSNDTWTSFYNKDSTLIGYKDKNGIVKIEPKFTTYIIADKFDNIIAATEESKGQWKTYYLTKTGRIIGRDSLLIFDNTPDCESEGFIRFKDSKTDKVGMFNKNGDVVIPAEYSDLTRVTNGMVIALKGATKKQEGEHFSWVGGKELLIDTHNKVLIDGFPYTRSLNFFSLEKTKTPHSDTTRKSFLAKDGSWYSFIDFEKEFTQWLMNDLFVNLNIKKLTDVSYDTIAFLDHENNTGSSSKEKFIKNNFLVLKNGLLEVLNPKNEYFISIDFPTIEEAKFQKYFNNCGEVKEWIYPVMVIAISHGSGVKSSQNLYQFLRTDNGYKLIDVTIRNEKINSN